MATREVKKPYQHQKYSIAQVSTTTPPQACVRPVLVELLDNAELTTFLLSAKNLKDKL